MTPDRHQKKKQAKKFDILFQYLIYLITSIAKSLENQTHGYSSQILIFRASIPTPLHQSYVDLSVTMPQAISRSQHLFLREYYGFWTNIHIGPTTKICTWIGYTAMIMGHNFCSYTSMHTWCQMFYL